MIHKIIKCCPKNTLVNVILTKFQLHPTNLCELLHDPN